MAKSGPKSAAELAAGPIIPGQRPAPPDDLSPEEQATWLAIVGSLPTDWFAPTNLPMLKELCRHIAYADWLAQDITRLRRKLAESDGDEKASRQAEGALARTLRLHGSQTDRIGNISTRLRLTQRAQYRRADAAAVGAQNAAYPKPWDWRS
jgi:hypothetical protein